jgi:hypothetical protein
VYPERIAMLYRAVDSFGEHVVGTASLPAPFFSLRRQLVNVSPNFDPRFSIRIMLSRLRKQTSPLKVRSALNRLGLVSDSAD